MFSTMTTLVFIFVSKQVNKGVLNLLLITEGKKKHYVLIKDLNRMLGMRANIINESIFACTASNIPPTCTEEILTKHQENCMVINGEQAIRMPEKGKNILQFKNHHKQMKVPFVIYADFEAITETCIRMQTKWC